MQVRAGRISNVRIAYGGMAATPRRAPATEAALDGRTWSAATFATAAAALAKDYAPISDFRASAEYRTRTAAALLNRFFLANEPGRKGALRVEDLMAERA
jgi:xanthine dehydrogenase small subunit